MRTLAYKVVTLGFEIAEIADNDELDDTTKATQSTGCDDSSFLGSLAGVGSGGW